MSEPVTPAQLDALLAAWLAKRADWPEQRAVVCCGAAASEPVLTLGELRKLAEEVKRLRALLDRRVVCVPVNEPERPVAYDDGSVGV